MNKSNESPNDSDDDDGFFLKPIKSKTSKINMATDSKNSNSGSTTSTISEILNQDINNNKNEIIKKTNTNLEINSSKNNNDSINKKDVETPKESNPKNNIIYSYLKIDKNNIFNKMTNQDYENIDETLDSFKGLQKKINSLFIPLLDKLSPNCEGDPITISKSLSKEIFKYERITKDIVEKYLNYFFSFRYELLYSTHFFLSKKTISYLGFILSYTYSKFNFYSIKTSKQFNSLAKKTVEKHEDALIDFYNSINDLGEEENTEKHKKMNFWKKNRTKYLVPPEINFLINRFVKIKTCEIELDFQGTSIDEKDFNLISLFLLNINSLFVNLDHFKINFINQKFQYDIYTSFFHDLLSSSKITKNIIKKNNIINPELIYDKKWNFIDKFNVQEYRILRKKGLKEEFNNKNLIFDEYNLFYINYLQKEINEEQMLNSTIEKRRTSKKESELKLENIEKNRIKRDFTVIEKSKINIKNIMKDKNNYMDIIKNNGNILNLLAILISSIGRLNHVKSLDIIMNESYNSEFIINCIKLFDIDSDSIDSNLHILDLLYNRLKDLQQLNLEFNSLDQLTFYKMLNLIYKNQNLLTLNISFFSSDITYFLRPMLKIYNQIGDAENLIKYNNINIEETILNSILPFFLDNLSTLFVIIKKLKKIENLGLNFDLPIIVSNQQSFIIPLIKFILNIIFLIDNKKIKKLTILAPSIVLDERILPRINEFFSEIDINKGENDLVELNLQIQLYKIIDIKNLISTKLIILSLGDFDLYTFKNLVKYLTSYKFSSESNLESLTIRLNKSITLFTTELKIILRQLFYIKISKLSVLNIYTNIIIKNEVNYKYLINILQNNWISNYTITLNSISNETLNKFNNLSNNITYFVPNDEDKAFWYLKYIFNVKYMNPSMNFISIKKCINCILKYLYTKKEVIINHSLENKLNSEKNS